MSTIVDIESIVTPIVGGLLAIATNFLFDYIKDKFNPKKEKTYGEKLKELVSQLSSATNNVDSILQEVATVAKERETAISSLENELRLLEEKEKTTKERIEALNNTPLPVAEHFAELMKSSEKSSARRDYMLFGAGVVVSTAIAVILKLLGWG